MWIRWIQFIDRFDGMWSKKLQAIDILDGMWSKQLQVMHKFHAQFWAFPNLLRYFFSSSILNYDIFPTHYEIYSQLWHNYYFICNFLGHPWPSHATWENALVILVEHILTYTICNWVMPHQFLELHAIKIYTHITLVEALYMKINIQIHL